jgi:hypothetical protein
MYKNRIRPTGTNLDLQSLIRRSEIPFDQRTRYVEFVCNVWNEGRFGTALADPVTLDWSGRPEPASFLDLDESGQSWLGKTDQPRAVPSHSWDAPAFRQSKPHVDVRSRSNFWTPDRTRIMPRPPLRQTRDAAPRKLQSTRHASPSLAPKVRRNPACGTAAG